MNIIRRDIKLICICLTCGFIISFVFCNIKTYCDNIQSSIASKIIRLHIKAESDSEKDQLLKLYVRNKVIEGIPAAKNREESLKLISQNIENIQKIAQAAVYEKGYAYDVSAEMKKDFFPTRYYGNIALPPGEYDTLEIKIGNGKGHNWWCVMYPPMCFSEIEGEVPENYEKQLSEVLSEDEYELVSEIDNPRIRVKFKIIEFIKEKF